MSVTSRQNTLLVAEDWKKIYQSFKNADFQSYDFENLRRTMIDYIRTNYPEDFNDYIESSEYLALIDLIAFLGQSIAFRVDLNARDNFLELAERREAVLRLARTISYNAKRNKAAQGLLKFSTVSTTENILDSNGRNLSGQIITWNDPSNANWNDQFLKVLNAAFPSTQQFGNPADSATIYGIPTEQYRINSNITGVPVFGFTKTVAGRAMNFEVTSTSFNGRSYIYEEPPKVGNTLACIYRDDGRGPASAGTGFFFNFTQGTLNQGVFTISQPNSNESVDIAANNINNTDVWLYRLDQNGAESEEWTAVSNFEANNIIYNSLNKNIRNIYAVITRAGDTISLQFSDGTFGNLPLGTFRTYYRVSNGLDYTITPQDLRSISVTIPYISVAGQVETLSLSLNLATSVSNASATESNESIKANAPATYYTQNRMITAEDYNISPLSVSTQVAKVKAVNRTSSGISRYFDLVDPTGKYSSTKLFADDGVIYQDVFTSQVKFSYKTKTDIEGIIYNTVFDILKKTDLRNFYYSKFIKYVTTSLNVSWKNVTTDSNTCTGHVRDTNSSTIYKVGSFTTTDLKYFTAGALVKFVAPSGFYFNTLDKNKLVYNTNSSYGLVSELWAEVQGVVDNGTASGDGILATGFGPITLNRIVPTGAEITQIIPKWRKTIDSSVITTMIDLIFSNKPFGLRYNATTQVWEIIFESNLAPVSPFSLGKQGDNTNKQQDASWLLLFTTDNEYYTVTSREQRYIFESAAQIRFYFDNSNLIYDSRTNSIINDTIDILSINTLPDGSGRPFTTDQKWDIVSDYTGLDGYTDTKKLIVTFADTDANGTVDNPELFLNIVSPAAPTELDEDVLKKTHIVLERYAISAGQEDYRYIDNTNNVVKILHTKPVSGINGQYYYFVDTGVVMKYSSIDGFAASLDYKVYVGRSNLKFQYNHSADYESRIDMGTSNIIDVFVLTKSYDTLYRQWLAGANIDEPLPPSGDELNDIVSSSLNLIKSISDEIVYHPVKYKVLFGQTASEDLRASFKVVKNPEQVLSDNDIKSRIITAINQFFSLENWDFGDTFYFAELATYVMSQLSPDISNFVIVPTQEGKYFGNLFEIKSKSDELFVNGATVDNIEIVSGLTPSIIKSIAGTAITTSVVSQQTVTSSSYGASNG